MFRLDGKVAVITGSSKGIGRAIAEAMAATGARVVISSRKGEACEAVAASVRGAGGEAMAIPCNVSRHEDLRALVDQTLEAWGRIDILVCNAAVNPHFGPMAEVSESAYDKIMSTNVKSNLWICNMAIPQMAARRDGVVIIISSIAGLKGNLGLGIYGLSKAADMQLAKNLALEWGPANVRVNCIAPGVVKTDFARKLWDDPKVHDKAVAAYPLGRLGEPEDIAGAAVFLASRASAWMTGQTLVIDGGVTISPGQYS